MVELGPHSEDGDGDVLETGRSGLPRRTLVIGVVVALAVLVGYVLLRRDHDSPRAAPTPTSPSTPAPTTSPSAVAVGDAAPVYAAGAVFALTNGRLTRIPLSGESTGRVQPGLADEDLLVPDVEGHRLWVVGLSAGWSATAVDLATLRPQTRTRAFPGHARGATVLGDDLYVAADGGLVALDPEGGVVRQDATARAFAVAADPTRERLLVLQGGGEELVAAAYRTAVTSSVGFGKGAIWTVGGYVWVGGYGQEGHAVLDRLDPRTLAPDVHSAAVPQLGPGADLLSAGEHDFLISGGSTVACVDGRTGRSSTYISTAAPAGSIKSFVLTPNGVKDVVNGQLVPVGFPGCRY